MLESKSRMRRELHVRFREGAGVQLPRATRLVILCWAGAPEVLAQTRRWRTQRGLPLNERKTRGCEGRQEPFTFLG
jgi:hypothetical protein